MATLHPARTGTRGAPLLPSGEAFALVQHLESSLHAAVPGFLTLGIGYPARILLAMGEGQRLEGRVRGGIGGQGTGERAGYLDLAGSRISLDRHLDAVSSLHASRLAYRAIQAKEKLAAHRCNRRAPAVAVHGRPNRKALRTFSYGGHVFVVEHNGGGWPTRNQRRRQQNRTHRVQSCSLPRGCSAPMHALWENPATSLTSAT